ncbi:MAG: hypothetical protein PUB97_08410 [Ruminococcus sp.]|nr:hypothetical protein [Ruminococcus sp.]
MAITQTFFTTNDEVSAWLRANLVPTYFDRIEDVTDGSYEYWDCYTGEHKLLRLNKNPKLACYVYGKEGSAEVYMTKAGILNTVLKAVRACANGVVLVPYIPTNPSYVGCLVITKDNNGNTTIVGTPDGSYYYSTPGQNSQTSSPHRLIVCNKNSRLSAYPYLYHMCANTYSTTMLSPMPVYGDDNAYTPNCLLTITQEYPDAIKLDIDGIKYINNGAWCLKDGG